MQRQKVFCSQPYSIIFILLTCNFFLMVSKGCDAVCAIAAAMQPFIKFSAGVIEDLGFLQALSISSYAQNMAPANGTTPIR